MRADQDWCLECGTAAPGRLGARPGWRAAFTVVGLTALLLTGAVAASFAALTGDAQRDASRPSQGAGTPIIAQTPGVGQATTPVTPGATGPGTKAPPAPPATAAKPPAASVAPAPSSGGLSGGSTSVSPTLLPKENGGKSSSGSGNQPGSSGGDKGGNSSSSEPNTIELAADAATTYDPDKRVGAEFGPAKNAVDSSLRSVWDVTVPVDSQPLDTGLVIDLGARYKLRTLKLRTPIPGFDVELYGSKSTKIPPDILDGRWDELTDRKNYADGASISLKGRGNGKVRYVALWFTHARNIEDPRIAIANVTVTGTK